MKYYLEGKKQWEPSKAAEYTKVLSRNQVSQIFKARTRMLNVKANCKNGNRDLKCRVCKNAEETQGHILEECLKINEKCQKVTKEMIFDENTEELRKTAKIIQERMEVLEKIQDDNTEQLNNDSQ